MCDKIEQVWTCPKHEYTSSDMQNLKKQTIGKRLNTLLFYSNLNPT
jgi:hypothetical protein